MWSENLVLKRFNSNVVVVVFVLVLVVGVVLLVVGV